MNRSSASQQMRPAKGSGSSGKPSSATAKKLRLGLAPGTKTKGKP